MILNGTKAIIPAIENKTTQINFGYHRKSERKNLNNIVKIEDEDMYEIFQIVLKTRFDSRGCVPTFFIIKTIWADDVIDFFKIDQFFIYKTPG